MTTKILSIMGFILLNFAVNAQAKLMVLSSIKPLTLIAQEVVGDSAYVDTLLPVSASPHDYPLKMSDYSRLKEADVFLWVGPELESFLQKPISNMPADRVISAYNLAAIKWPAHDSSQDHNHEHDPHLWLDPRNAVVVANALTTQLIRIDPRNKLMYERNMQIFAAKMEELDGKLAAKLAPFSDHGFAVYHEGYGHFVSHYGLRQLNYVTLTPEQRPGAKHLKQLRESLAEGGRCLFLEPQNEQRSMHGLARELNLNIGILDALGEQAGIDNYSQLLELMTNAFVACLKSEPR